jgi:alpha-tubulin suppressor-like RCC1 family protein
MPVITTGVQYSGIWNRSGHIGAVAAGTWPAAYNNVSLFSWGANPYGNLGLGNTTYYSSPKQVGSSAWVTISAGGPGNTCMAIKGDGTLWAWGYNAQGQLGFNNTTHYSSPKQVGALTGWSKVSSGSDHTLAIKTNGTMWSWGYNATGQLGLGSTGYFSSPNQIGALTTWSAISAGFRNSLAVKTDGTLWSWGAGTDGRLGLGNTTDYSSPKQVGALTAWLSVASGSYYSFAIKTDGTLWSWGKNTQGQLGLGNTTSYSSPKQIGALTTWYQIDGGGSTAHVLATKTDGTLWSWGNNSDGELGLGNTTSYSSPKQIGALTDWLSIACGTYNSSLATRTNGTLWGWGNNTQGILASGNKTDFSSPRQVGSLTTWSKVSAGQSWAVALTT